MTAPGNPGFPDGTLDQRRTRYFSANWQMLQEYIDDDIDAQSPDGVDRTMQYVWGVRYIDDIAVRRENTNFTNDSPSVTYDKSYYHLTDAQFSTVAVIDGAANVLERVQYDEYGRARLMANEDVDGDGDVDQDDYDIYDGNIGATIPEPGDFDRDGAIGRSDEAAILAATGTNYAFGRLSVTDNVIGWDGYVFNAEMDSGGIYTVRFRHYRPDLGRWVERDPLQYMDGQILYMYCNIAPTSSGDFLGLFQHDFHGYGTPVDDFVGPPEPCKVNVHISVGGDSVSNVAGYWSKGHSGPHIWLSRDPTQEEWNCALAELQVELGNCCIDSIVITGHGSPGSLPPFTSSTIAIKNSNSRKFLDALKSLKCGDGTVELRACNQADDNEGIVFMSKLALLLEMKIHGIDDTYAVIPHGKEYCVFPDGRIVLIKDHGPYKGGWIYLLDRTQGKVKAAVRGQHLVAAGIGVEKLDACKPCGGTTPTLPGSGATRHP